MMLCVSVLELPARWGQPEEALREVDASLAAGEPTELVVLPEMSLNGYVSPDGDFDLTRFAEAIDGPTVGAVRAIAERYEVHLAAPLVLREADGVYNALIVVGPDGPIATYRKRHPWFPERWATAGATPPPLFSLGGLRVTAAICFDGHFLADDAAEVLAEADLLLFTSAWVDDEHTRIPLLGALAHRFNVSIANANWGRGVVDVPGQGGSCILDGHGAVVAVVTAGGRRINASVAARPRA